MKIAVIFFVFTLSVVQLSLAEEVQAVTSISDVLAVNTRGVDMFDSTRKQINKFVTDLTNNGNTAQILLTELSDTVVESRDSFNTRSLNITSGIWTEIQTVIDSFLSAAVVLPEALWTCVANQVDQAGLIVNQTITNGITCFSTAIDSVVTLISSGTTVISNAITLGLNIASAVVACGVSTLTNFAQVGICLYSIIQNYQSTVNSLLGQIASLVATAATYVITVPVTVGVCVAAVASTTAIQTTTLVTDLVTCGADIIGQVVGQS